MVWFRVRFGGKGGSFGVLVAVLKVVVVEREREKIKQSFNLRNILGYSRKEVRGDEVYREILARTFVFLKIIFYTE